MIPKNTLSRRDSKVEPEPMSSVKSWSPDFGSHVNKMIKIKSLPNLKSARNVNITTPCSQSLQSYNDYCSTGKQTMEDKHLMQI